MVCNEESLCHKWVLLQYGVDEAKQKLIIDSLYKPIVFFKKTETNTYSIRKVLSQFAITFNISHILLWYNTFNTYNKWRQWQEVNNSLNLELYKSSRR